MPICDALTTLAAPLFTASIIPPSLFTAYLFRPFEVIIVKRPDHRMKFIGIPRRVHKRPSVLVYQIAAFSFRFPDQLSSLMVQAGTIIIKYPLFALNGPEATFYRRDDALQRIARPNF